jgi:hypothetical protein
MGLRLVKLDFGMELFFLVLEFLSFCSGHVFHHFRVETQFLLGFIEFFQLIHHVSWFNHTFLELGKHFCEHFDFFLKLFLFSFQCSDQFICLTLIDHGLVLNLFGLISVSES